MCRLKTQVDYSIAKCKFINIQDRSLNILYSQIPRCQMCRILTEAGDRKPGNKCEIKK